MDFKTYAVKNILMPFFVIVTGVCAVMAVVGMIYEPQTRFGYQALASPLIFGAATTLPTLVNYSRRELSVREALVRKLIQLLLIEGIVLLTIHSRGALRSVSLGISLALSVLLVFGAAHLVFWIDDRRTADVINRALREMQEEE